MRDVSDELQYETVVAVGQRNFKVSVAHVPGLPTLSIVVPVYNEAEILTTFHRTLMPVLDALDHSSEVLYVNDGSTDQTGMMLRCLTGATVRVIHLARNFGHQAAITAGLAAARGQAVIVMDADLQDPPSLIPHMVDEWIAGAEVVSARRNGRAGESWVMLYGRYLFYRVARAIASVDLTLDVGDFRLLDRKVVDAVNALPECRRYVRGLVAWVGFTQVTIPYDRPIRAGGTSKYSWRKLLRLGMDGITAFSTWPLHLVSLCGFALAGVAALLVGYGFVGLLRGQTPSGWVSVFVVVSALAGVQLLALGVLGLYVGRIYEEVKRRPAYVVRS